MNQSLKQFIRKVIEEDIIERMALINEYIMMYGFIITDKKGKIIDIRNMKKEDVAEISNIIMRQKYV